MISLCRRRSQNVLSRTFFNGKSGQRHLQNVPILLSSQKNLAGGAREVLQTLFCHNKISGRTCSLKFGPYLVLLEFTSLILFYRAKLCRRRCPRKKDVNSSGRVGYLILWFQRNNSIRLLWRRYRNWARLFLMFGWNQAKPRSCVCLPRCR